MHSLTFNSKKKDWLILKQGRSKAPFAPINRTLISTPGMDGAFLSSTNLEPMIISQPVAFFVDDNVHALQLKDEVASWLFTKEPVPLQFPDEPGRTYFAVVQNTIEDFEKFIDLRQGTIQFLLPDPFGYGPEQTPDITSDAFIIHNKGTAEADPIFELIAKKKTTFAMISNENDEYNMIGRPADVDETIVNEKTVLFDENGDTLNTWTQSGQGNLVKGSLGIQVGSYGSGVGSWHGPEATKEIAPIQDFEVEFIINITNEHQASRTYRNMIYMYDENMNEIAHMRMWDYSQATYSNIADVRIGSYAGDNTDIYLADKNNYSYPNLKVWNGIMRLTRRGNKFELYIARVAQNGVNTHILRASYIDNVGDLLGKLKYIRIGISKHDTLGANEIGINRIKVSRLNDLTIDQTPYILDVGDKVEFNHKDDDILVNGEPRNDLKNFGGSFFALKKGSNTILVTPEDSFDIGVKYRDKYL